MELKKAAEIIAGWTQVEANKGNMLAKNGPEIETEIETGNGRVIFDESGVPMAYGRLKEWPTAGVELGSLVVDPTKRREGWGLKAVASLAQMVNGRGQKGFFCLAENEISANLFEKKLGAASMAKENLPEEVWELCFAPNPCAHAPSFPNCPCQAFDLNSLRRK